VRGKIIDKYPDEVRKKIEYLIDSNFNGKSIYEWLNANWFPKWKQNGMENLIVGERTVRNWLRNYAPEKRLLSQSYINNAVKRMGEDIDTLEVMQKALKDMMELARGFPEDKLSLRDKGEKRRILKEIANISQMLEGLRIRLGLSEEKPKETIHRTFIDMVKEIKHKHDDKKEKTEEEKLYEKAVKK